MKNFIISFLDLVDVVLLRHRFPAFCAWLLDSDWWGPARHCALCGEGHFSGPFAPHECE